MSATMQKTFEDAIFATLMLTIAAFVFGVLATKFSTVPSAWLGCSVMAIALSSAWLGYGIMRQTPSYRLRFEKGAYHG